MPGKFVVPEVVVTHFGLAEGYTVGDFGAGGGFYLKPLSAAVGPSGKLYACDIQKQLVDKLGDQARLLGLQNVAPLWCDLEEVGGIKLPNATLDVGLLINTLFLFEDKATGLTECVRVIKPGGTLVILDWSESFGGMGPRPEDVVTKDTAILLAEAAHLMYEREFPAGDHHYGIVMRKV